MSARYDIYLTEYQPLLRSNIALSTNLIISVQLVSLVALAKLLDDGLADGLVALHAEVLEVLVPPGLFDDALERLLASAAAHG